MERRKDKELAYTEQTGMTTKVKKGKDELNLQKSINSLTASFHQKLKREQLQSLIEKERDLKRREKSLRKRERIVEQKEKELKRSSRLLSRKRREEAR